MLTHDGERQSWEGPDIVLLRASRPLAKEAHQCAWCGKEIRKRQRYVRRVFLEDGRFVSEATCAACEDGLAD